jgi:hypothetical protein
MARPVLGLILTPQRQSFAERRLVDLDDIDSCGLEIVDLGGQRRSDLVRHLGTRNIVADKTPLRHCHRSRQHTLERFLG